MTFGDILTIVLAFILPPTDVATQVGFAGAFWWNPVIRPFSFGALGLHQQALEQGGQIRLSRTNPRLRVDML